MLQQISSRFLFTASAISVGTYLFYIIRKYYYSHNKILNIDSDLFVNSELSNHIMDSNDVSTASLPFNNSEIYNDEIEEEKSILSLLNISIHPIASLNNDNLFSLNTTQYHSMYDDNIKNDYNSDKDSIYSNFSCETAVGFKTPFVNSSKSIT